MNKSQIIINDDKTKNLDNNQDIEKLYNFILDYNKMKFKKFDGKIRILPSMKSMKFFLDLDEIKIKELLKILIYNKKILNYNDKKYNHKKSLEELKSTVKKQIDLNNLNIYVFKVFCFIIGLLAIILTINFSYNFFLEFLNKTFAMMFAIVIIGFSVILFESVFIFKRKFYLIIWSLCLIFTLLMSLFGQMTLEKNKTLFLDSEKLKFKSNALLLKSYEDKATLYKDELQIYKNELSELNKIADKNNTIYYKMNIAKKKINDLSMKIVTIEEDKEKIFKKNENIEESKKGFFEILEDITSIKKDIIKFYLFLALSFFLDLASPICFLNSLFLEKKEK